MDLRDWALGRFSPVVTVVATPAAEAMCRDNNGLGVTDLLRPYGVIRNINVPVRSVGEQSYRITEFKLRLHEASALFQPAVEIAEAHLAQTLSQAGEDLCGDTLESMEAVHRAVSIGQDLTPWFSSYREEFFRMLSFTDFESYDHPVACLFVSDGNSDSVPDAFSDLDKPDSYPCLMKHGVMDPNILKNYVILCDHSTGSEERAETKANRMRAIHGQASAHVLKINGGTGDAADAGGVAGIWRSTFLPCIPGGGAGEPDGRPDHPDVELGLKLTAADLEGIAVFMRDFTTRGVLPFLEARIRALNHQITSTRRGLKNSLKAFWWRSGKAPEEGVASSDKSPAAAAGMYNYSTVESQMRYLSDMAFMMHDFTLAASTLRLLQGDYKADKAMRHYAAAQEMLALSLIMLGEAGNREAEECLLQAYQSYTQCGPGFGRYATRAMLHLAELHKSNGRFRDAKNTLMKAHFDEVHSRAALLLEQSATCLLCSSPPLERKFAFHLVLAGLRFHQCDQRLLADRAYRQVIAIYGGHRWGLIEEHIHDVLGRYAQDSGDLNTAVEHTMALLGGCAHRSESVQGHYLKQFCKAVKENERRLKVSGQDAQVPMVLELPLPVVAADTAKFVHVDGVRYKGNPAADRLDEAGWDRLHESLVIGGASSAMGSGASNYWLASKPSKTLDEAVGNICCAGEEVGVDINFSNPLDISLVASDVRLLCELEPSAASSSQDKSGAAGKKFELRRQDLTLRSKQKITVRLLVKPLVPGLLRVKGVEWCLNRAVHGRHLFRQRTEPRWKGDASHQRLLFSVIPSMPRLAAAIQGLPSTLYAGELSHCLLQLRNESEVPLQGIRISISHPAEVMCASRRAPSVSDLATSLEDAWRAEAASGSLAEGVVQEAAELVELPPAAPGEQPSGFSSSMTPRVWRLPKDLTLEHGREVFWPLWVSPQRIGTHSFQVALYYERGAAAGGRILAPMRHRVLCIGHSISVVPALKVQTRVLRDATCLWRSLMHVSIQNYPNADESFQIRQVSCITPGARLQGLRSDRSIAQPAASESAAFVDLPTAATVHAGETTSLYVHLYEQQSDEAEAPGLSGAAPLPVTTGPLQWFHSRALEAQAKLQQRAKQHKFSAGGLQRQQQGVEAKLAVIWEVRAAGQNPRLGSCLAQQLPSPPRPPLQAVLKGPHRVEHNFKASPLCVVALRLLVANGLIHRTAVSVDCGAPGVSVSPPPIPGTWHTTEGAVGGGMGAQEPPHGQGQPQAGRQSGLTPSAAWQWCGQSHTFLGPLDPGRSSEVGLQVAIMAPGHYQLQGYKLAYSEDDLRSPLDSVPGPPCSITVVQAS